MRFPVSVVLLSSLVLPSLSWAQLDVVGAVMGSLTGTVQNEAGDLVAPDGAVHATIVASDSSGQLTALISGRASSAGALGLSIAFDASYEAATGEFVGLYSDKPGVTPDLDIIFTPVGDLSWVAQIGGIAASSTGDRSYDLSLGISIPEAAIYTGDTLPSDAVFRGMLSNTVSTVVPLVVPEIQLVEDLQFDFSIEGNWSANVVPQDDASQVITGEASGTFSGSAGDVTATVPVFGTLVLPANFYGAFAGNLFSVSETELAYRGSWSAASGDQSFGGSVSIIIPLTDISTFPFQFEGTMPMETGFALMPVFNLPLTMAGSFPLLLSSP